MDTLSTVALALGSSWVSGLRLYAMVFTLGLLQKFGYTQLPGDLAYLAHPWVIGISGTLLVVEFFADKIPWVDSTWDAVHTFIRIPAGAILASSAFAHYDKPVQLAAMLVGGTLALSAHGTKATIRSVANLSPEPVSNIVLSGSEDVFAAIMAAATIWIPVLAIVLVVICVGVSLLILPRIWRVVASRRKSKLE